MVFFQALHSYVGHWVLGLGPQYWVHPPLGWLVLELSCRQWLASHSHPQCPRCVPHHHPHLHIHSLHRIHCHPALHHQHCSQHHRLHRSNSHPDR